MNWPPRIALTVGPITPVQLALFAAASGDHNPLHLDPDAARRSGFDRPVVHGMLTMALVGRLFTDALGPGTVRELQTRFAGVALVNETLVFAATLEGEDGARARYTLRGTSASGTEVVTGSATVARPA